MTATVFLVDVVIECVNKNNKALPLGISMEILWKRYIGSFWSFVAAVVRLPISSINFTAWTSHEPAVSMEIGWKMWVEIMSEYLVVLIAAACLASAPAAADVDMMCDSAYVSGMVTSQASGFPQAHGIMVTPSCRLPLWETSPVGSLCAGICAFLIALQMMSFNMAWRWCLGMLLLHERPWRPLASTSFPQTQL